jgi:hypothetical protein
MMATMANLVSDDGHTVYETLDGLPLKNDEVLGVVWPDQIKQNHMVMIISEIVPTGVREKAHIKISHHGVQAPVSLMHLISLGVEVSRKSIW